MTKQRKTLFAMLTFALILPLTFVMVACTGADGPEGQRGATITFGDATPTSTTGHYAGDVFIVLGGNVYQLVGTTWTIRGELPAQGEPGEDGEDGVQMSEVAALINVLEASRNLGTDAEVLAAQTALSALTAAQRAYLPATAIERITEAFTGVLEGIQTDLAAAVTFTGEGVDFRVATISAQLDAVQVWNDFRALSPAQRGQLNQVTRDRFAALLDRTPTGEQEANPAAVTTFRGHVTAILAAETAIAAAPATAAAVTAVNANLVVRAELAVNAVDAAVRGEIRGTIPAAVTAAVGQLAPLAAFTTLNVHGLIDGNWDVAGAQGAVVINRQINAPFIDVEYLPTSIQIDVAGIIAAIEVITGTYEFVDGSIRFYVNGQVATVGAEDAADWGSNERALSLVHPTAEGSLLNVITISFQVEDAEEVVTTRVIGFAINVSVTLDD